MDDEPTNSGKGACGNDKGKDVLRVEREDKGGVVDGLLREAFL